MSSTHVEFVPVRTAAEIERVAQLASEIWYEYYVPILGRAQVDYMVGKFQTAPAIAAQIESGYEYFLMCSGGTDAGYAAVQAQPQEQRLFLSKLYLLDRCRGSGTGRACMEFIERLGRKQGLKTLWLTVNKGNPSVKVYQRLGFAIAAEIVIDIGGGFVMDDYRMEKKLEPTVGLERQV